MDRAELERLDREALVTRAQDAGIRRARLLTRPELIDELLRLDLAADPTHLKKNRGFFGIARDLLTRVVERGLHLPDAADRLRAALGSSLPQVPRPEPQAVPTVTLAEIYAAQGHKLRAIETLQRVLELEPEHAAARALLEKLEEPSYVAPAPLLPPEEEAVATVEPSPAESQPPEAAVVAAEPEIEPEPITPPVWTPEPTTTILAPTRSECVAIPLTGGKSYVWWQLASDARRLAEESTFVVRAVVLVPTWDGPRREVRDLTCDPAASEAVVSDLPKSAVVRVAVGVLRDGDVVPLAHSPALERSEHLLETTASRGLVEWTLAGPVPVVLDEAVSIARAAERARGLEQSG